VRDQLNGTIATEFAPRGLTCLIEIPLAGNAHDAAAARAGA